MSHLSLVLESINRFSHLRHYSRQGTWDEIQSFLVETHFNQMAEIPTIFISQILYLATKS